MSSLLGVSNVNNQLSLTLDDAALKAYAKRNLGQDFLSFREKRYMESITDPKTYIANKEKFRNTFYEEASDNFAKTFKKLYSEAGTTEEIAKAIALKNAENEVQRSLGIVEQLYPSSLNNVASESLFNQSVIGNAGRLESSMIRNSERVVVKAAPKRRKAAKRRGKGKK